MSERNECDDYALKTELASKSWLALLTSISISLGVWSSVAAAEFFVGGLI